jgi:hypothetical protein
VQDFTGASHFRFYGFEFRVGFPHLGFQGGYLVFGILHNLLGHCAGWQRLPKPKHIMADTGQPGRAGKEFLAQLLVCGKNRSDIAHDLPQLALTLA